MKVQVVLPLTIVASVALMGIMRIRKREQDQQHRRASFGDIKLRVTNDVLGEYQSEKDSAQVNLDTAQKETSALDSAVKMGKDKADKTKGELDICNQGKTAITDELTILETELKNLQAANEKEEASWNSEVQTLKSQLEAQSPVCNFLKEGTQLESKLCAKKEEPEAAKKEEPKAEAAKQEEPKAEAAKQEEPKAEAAKQEEPKAEAAKQEEPKAEAAKQEEPKAEAAKQEEPKAEAAKQEEPKAEAAKQEEPKAEAPKKQEV